MDLHVLVNMLDNINSIFIDLFAGFIIYILAVFVGIFIKKNNEFMIPIIFGIMFSSYLSIYQLYTMGEKKYKNVY